MEIRGMKTRWGDKPFFDGAKDEPEKIYGLPPGTKVYVEMSQKLDNYNPNTGVTTTIQGQRFVGHYDKAVNVGEIQIIIRDAVSSDGKKMGKVIIGLGSPIVEGLRIFREAGTDVDRR